MRFNYGCFYGKCIHFRPIGSASANSVESGLGCTSSIYFDNVTLTLHNVTLTSQITLVIAAKQTVIMTFMFSLKYRNSEHINLIYSAD